MSIGAKFPKTDSGISVMSFLVHNGLFSCRYSKKQFRSYAYAIRVREEVVGSIPIKNCLQYGGIFWSRLRSNVSFFTFTFS